MKNQPPDFGGPGLLLPIIPPSILGGNGLSPLNWAPGNWKIGRLTAPRAHENFSYYPPEGAIAETAPEAQSC